MAKKGALREPNDCKRLCVKVKKGRLNDPVRLQQVKGALDLDTLQS